MEGEWRDLEISLFCLSIAAPSYPIGCVLYTTIPISIIACSYCYCRSSCILSENKYLLLLTHSKTATFFGRAWFIKPGLHYTLVLKVTQKMAVAMTLALIMDCYLLLVIPQMMTHTTILTLTMVLAHTLTKVLTMVITLAIALAL